MPLPKVSVAGGSIGGLCAAVALHRVGCDVHVYERSTAALSSRGAGIVVQPELLRLIEAGGAVELPVTSCTHRRTVSADGSPVSRTAMPQRFTSWEAIHRALRASLPEERYHLGARVRDLRDDGATVELRFADDASVRSDLLVLADGARSALRDRLGVRVSGGYAGYVAWRGTVAEAALSDDLARRFDDAFVFCEARDGGHALAYFIPGDDAVTERGARRLNWV